MPFKVKIIGLLWCLAVIPVDAQEASRYVFEAAKMGTTFRLVLYAPDSARAQGAAAAAFAEADSMNRIFSNYEANSAINRLTRRAVDGKMAPVSPPLWEVLTFSQKLWRQSDGAFDVTIGPLAKLWRRAFQRKTFPEREKLEAARALVGFDLLHLNAENRSVGCQKEGMLLDFGGIAKGYTGDRMAEVLQRKGIDRYLIDLGGDLCMGDPPPGKEGWKVRLPDGRFKLMAKVALAASGDHYRFLEWKGRRYSHIINPQTGLGVTDQHTVSVIAQQGMRADAYASAISVMGPEKGRRLARQAGIQVYFFHPTND